ncbi:MAG: AbrB/MazE/SpoVT family DNA-binding domain-containing protein [Chloroflexi bacterium]|nr:AbrB/MazE/SpoVT family DNA-binding domain-containing protein [Chloroflexota bacterium]
MSKVGRKGQVVIDRAIRRQLQIGPGWEAIQRLVDDRVEITFLPPAPTGSLRGRLAPFVAGPGAGERDFADIREQAWHEALAEDQT